MRSLPGTIIVCIVVAAPTHAQDPGMAAGPMIGFGHIHHLVSGALGEERKYFVYEPAGERGRALPTIVVLDGDGHFLHTATTVRFLHETGRMPAARVIGIPNVSDRMRDLTPTLVVPEDRARIPTAGGATAMLDFIAGELLPAVESAYGPAPMRIFVGHSLGGITGVHAMLTRPNLFHALVLISPSLWLDRERFTDSLLAMSRRAAPVAPWVYGTVGALEDPVQVTPFRRITAALRATPPSGWRFLELAGEDHGTTPLRTTYSALEALFAQFTIPRDSSRLLGIAGIDRRYDALRARFGYPGGTPESALNALGYEEIAAGGPGARARAIATFRENVRRFPRSANTRDSLGDALRADGDFIGAAACYAAAVHLGRTLPRGGETFANERAIPGATAKMRDMLGRIGREGAVEELAKGC